MFYLMPSVFHFGLVKYSLQTIYVYLVFVFSFSFVKIKETESPSFHLFHTWLRHPMKIICKHRLIVFFTLLYLFSFSSKWSIGNLQKINVQELYTRQKQSLRTWSEFFNTAKFRAPTSITIGRLIIHVSKLFIYYLFFEAFRRLLANVEYFQANYYIVILILSVYCV